MPRFKRLTIITASAQIDSNVFVFQEFASIVYRHTDENKSSFLQNMEAPVYQNLQQGFESLGLDSVGSPYRGQYRADTSSPLKTAGNANPMLSYTEYGTVPQVNPYAHTSGDMFYQQQSNFTQPVSLFQNNQYSGPMVRGTNQSSSFNIISMPLSGLTNKIWTQINATSTIYSYLTISEKNSSGRAKQVSKLSKVVLPLHCLHFPSYLFLPLGMKEEDVVIEELKTW